MSTLDKINDTYLKEVQTKGRNPFLTKRKWRYAILCLAAVVLCMVVTFQVLKTEQHRETQGKILEHPAQSGKSKTQEMPEQEKEVKETEMPIQKDLDEVCIEVNTEWELEEGNRTILLGLVNPKDSAYALRVVLFLKDQPEEELYGSGILNPGGEVKEAELTKALPQGEYEAVIRYSFYQEKMEEPFGEYELDASLHVS